MDYFFITLILFSGALLQGITGFGSGLLAVPLLSLLLPLSNITPTLSLVNCCLTGFLLYQTRHYCDLRQWSALIVAGVVGSLLGNQYLLSGDTLTLQRGLAILVIVTAVCLLSGWRLPLPATATSKFGVGLLAGFCNGALTLGGPPVVLFLNQQNIDKQNFRATLSAFFFIIALTNSVSFALQDQYQLSMSPVLLAMLIGVIGGVFIGHRIAAMIPELAFKRLTLAVVVGSGLLVLLSSG
ncbi:sulfite exporter TauE/SafE family protein [Idiomarina xiamenensis]|uniref:Probable membrane transporter protein n=1 Tax=Idiomarina xiamenensis 10-D-4 TaxID=740709 RepID=K2L4P7_9GAMM|nr:sulfite exporter TauE/SafE family protein [Idiomarina xiamenensis]EKE84795.1 permease [Idiomarina xiamenensis 10-D-4]